MVRSGSLVMAGMATALLIGCTYSGPWQGLDGKTVTFHYAAGSGEACFRVPQAEHDAAPQSIRCIVPAGVDCVVKWDGSEEILMHELAHCAVGRWHDG